MSHHIPDVTKMIGWTPRTDAARPPYTELQEFVSAEFARTLERELNAANERIKNLESALSTVENIDKVNAYQDLESANERIKRLKEAGDRLAAFTPPSADRIAQWQKAKESKP